MTQINTPTIDTPIAPTIDTPIGPTIDTPIDTPIAPTKIVEIHHKSSGAWIVITIAFIVVGIVVVYALNKKRKNVQVNSS